MIKAKPRTAIDFKNISTYAKSSFWKNPVECATNGQFSKSLEIQPRDPVTMSSRDSVLLRNGRVLSADGEIVVRDLHLRDGVISEDLESAAVTLDCTDLLVLPGIVDVHGDAFERELMPRPGVGVDFPVAMASVDAQLLANGISTAFHGLTISWEPGLRSLDAGRQFMKRFASSRASFRADHRVQLRWETFAHAAVNDVVGWMAMDPNPAVAFNDHTTSTLNKIASGQHQKLDQWSQRAGMTPQDYIAAVEDVAALAPCTPSKIATIAEVARLNDVVLLSHDDRTLKDREEYRALGADVCEFPLTMEAASSAIEHGEPTVLGAPNVMRGGSHTGALSAEDAIRDGLCTILASDYFYPSLMAAVARLVDRGVTGLEAAWALVSKNPAAAMGLTDRGSISPGKRADLILVDFADHPQVIATIVEGKIALRLSA